MVVVSNGPPSSPLIVHDMPQYGSFRVIVRGGGGRGAVLQCSAVCAVRVIISLWSHRVKERRMRRHIIINLLLPPIFGALIHVALCFGEYWVPDISNRFHVTSVDFHRLRLFFWVSLYDSRNRSEKAAAVTYLVCLS